MSDAAHANAVAKRDSLAAEINKLQQLTDDLRREYKRVSEWLTAWDEFAEGLVTKELSAGPAVVPVTRKGRSVNPPKEEIADLARELATDRNQPVSRKAIRTFLENEKGIFLEGSDPDMVLSTMLWRMKDRIIRLKGHGYWPRERDYAPAEYRADASTEYEENSVDAEDIVTEIADLTGQLSSYEGPEQKSSE